MNKPDRTGSAATQRQSSAWSSTSRRGDQDIIVLEISPTKAPKLTRGRECLLQAMETRVLEWVKKLLMRMQAYKHNHQDIMGSIGLWSKE
ncbi:hypothetical protein HAX54_025343, partial [Datura stramonium]|nr:hypothetical protein [Datura stramonium]